MSDTSPADPDRNKFGILRFVIGLLLITASSAFAVSSIGNRPIIDGSIILVVCIVALNYFIDGFLATLALYIVAITLVIIFPSLFVFIGTPFSDQDIVLLSWLNPSYVPPQGHLLDDDRLLTGLFVALFFAGAAIRLVQIRFHHLRHIVILLAWGIAALLFVEGASLFLRAGITWGSLGLAVVCFAATILLGVIVYKQAGGDVICLRDIVQPIDNQFTGYIASRWFPIAVTTLLYGYVAGSFASVYYYVDNCDHAYYPCSVVNYEPYLQTENQNTEKCWSFHSIAPAGASGDEQEKEHDLCNFPFHTNQTPFDLKRFFPYLYFSVVTSTTVGYGDIYPLSISAAWIVIIHHFISIVLLVATAGQLAGFAFEERERASTADDIL